MSEFEVVANSEGAQKIYRHTVNAINLQQHPDFLKRPIKILDVGGGIGSIGQLLKNQCEESFGPLSSKEFSLLVDYVNIDLDKTALEKSPGRNLSESSINIYNLLNEEEPFDFILSVSPSPAVNKYTPKKLDRIGVPNDFLNPMRSIMLSSYGDLKTFYARIDMINTALLLSGQGRYILASFTDQETLNGMVKYSKENNLGLEVEKIENLLLDETTKGLFTTTDTKKKKGKYFNKIKNGRSPYRMIVFRTKGIADRKKTIATLDGEIYNCNRLSSFCWIQEQFGTNWFTFTPSRCKAKFSVKI